MNQGARCQNYLNSEVLKLRWYSLDTWGLIYEQAGLLKPYLSVSEAGRIYGRSVVERWIKEELVKVLKDGNASAKCRISRLQIEAVAKSANRSTYLTKEDRI